MFLKKNKFIHLKSGWVVFGKEYGSYIYEDIFIRKYIFSFLKKFNKSKKVIGSIYILRTFGCLFIKVFFYNPIKKQNFFGKGLKQRTNNRSQAISVTHLFYWKKKVKPLNKYKKQLIFLRAVYNLEKLLNYQIYYKFINIFSVDCLRNQDKKIRFFFHQRLRRFKNRNKLSFLSTLFFIKNLFFFKQPDSLLLAKFLSFQIQSLHRHTPFILFVQEVLRLVCGVYNHVLGVKLIFSGKLNGFSRATIKKIQVGQVPLQTIVIQNIFGFSESFTKYGKLGIKIWVFLRKKTE